MRTPPRRRASSHIDGLWWARIALIVEKVQRDSDAHRCIDCDEIERFLLMRADVADFGRLAEDPVAREGLNGDPVLRCAGLVV
jgi:hypothetical protein